MLLEGKNAVIYGAGGSIGGTVVRAFASEGAHVFLAGRTLAKLHAVAGEIRSSGGVAETAEVDALDEKAVDEHADRVAAEARSIDVSFNLITHPSVHGIPTAEMAVEDYMVSVVTAVRTTFLTARAAARHMIGQDSGYFSSSAARENPCATTTSGAPRLPSTRLSPCGGNSRPSLDHMASARSP